MLKPTILPILYLVSSSGSQSKKFEKEAYEMANFLKENGVDSSVSRFEHEEGCAYDAVLGLAYDAPFINTPLMVGNHGPLSSYIVGLENTRKHIEKIKEFISKTA